MSGREERLIRSCEVANDDAEVREIEKEFDALIDEIPEPWEHSPHNDGMR